MTKLNLSFDSITLTFGIENKVNFFKKEKLGAYVNHTCAWRPGMKAYI